MKKLLGVLVSCMILGSVRACMPNTEYDVVIGEFGGYMGSGSFEGKIVDKMVSLSGFFFPFVDGGHYRPTKPKQWILHDEVSVPISGETLAMIAYNRDGDFPADYVIVGYSTLRCENDVITLTEKVGHPTLWNREKNGCYPVGGTILNGFMEGDENVWLDKLRKQYPTCADLKKAMSDDPTPYKPEGVVRFLDAVWDRVVRLFSW